MNLVTSILYLFDQKINLFLGGNGFGFLFLVFILCFSFANKVKIKSYELLLIYIFGVYEFISVANSPCTPSLKLVLSLFCAVPFLIVINRNYLIDIVLSQNASNFIIISTTIMLIADAYLNQIFGFDRPLRFYYENSHIALYMLPFILYRILRDAYDPIPWVSALVISIYALSATFVIPIFLLIVIIIIRESKSNYLLLKILVMIFLLIFIYQDHIGDRLYTILNYSDSTRAKNISSLVWLNGYSIAKNYLIESSYLGVGLNQMGCNNISDLGFYSETIKSINNQILLNYEDGSFAFSKIVSELGVLGLALVFYISGYSLYIIYIALKQSKFSKIYAIKVAGSISILTDLYIRNGGYFQLHFLLSLAMLFYEINTGLNGANFSHDQHKCTNRHN